MGLVTEKLLKKLLCMHYSHSKVNNHGLKKKCWKHKRERWEAQNAFSKRTLSRDKIKEQFGKNVTLTLTKILPEK